jgi:phage terminase large subunit-like protein
VSEREEAERPVDVPRWERALEERAIREGWPVPPELKLEVIRELGWIATRRSSFPPSNREVTQAAKAILAADSQNLRARELASDAGNAQVDAAGSDPTKFEWYFAGCPCAGVAAGECKAHPRARPSQRPPEGDWRVWAYVAGRGAGKTRAGAEWIRDRVERGVMRLGALVGATKADVRDILIEGPSGILATAAPDCVPTYQPSRRRVAWPNGAVAICLSGEEPDDARGLNIDTLWADELASWQHPETTWDNAMLALRTGSRPQALITTTPRRLAVLRRILVEPSTIRTTATTYENRAHLAAEFLDQIVSLYENTRLGRQEIYAELLETTDGVWFHGFAAAKHVSVEAEYDRRFKVWIAIDAGTSRHTAAVFFQVRPGLSGRPRICVFGEYHALDVVSERNAKAIRALAGSLPSQGRIDCVRLDPAAKARSSLGPAAYGEYERVFGSQITDRWPFHLVLDGLELIDLLLDHGDLLVHPRCTGLKDAFLNYSKRRRGGQWIDYPADGHPEEDFLDALRGGAKAALPEGTTLVPSAIRAVRAGSIM